MKFYSTLEEMGRQDFPKLLRSALLQVGECSCDMYLMYTIVSVSSTV